MDHPSFAGSSGRGSTLVLAFVLFALWLSITQRIQKVRAVLAGPPVRTPEPGEPGAPGYMPPYSPHPPGGIHGPIGGHGF